MSELKKIEETLKKFVQETKKSKPKYVSTSTTMVSEISKEVADNFIPIIQGMADNFKISKEELINIIKEIKINPPEVKVPEIVIPEFPAPKVVVPPLPEIKLPEIVIPEIKIPTIKTPKIEMPDEMNIKGWVSLMNYDRDFLTNPLPVQIRDGSGNPIKLFENLTQIVSGGGKSDFITIKGFSASAYADYINADGRLKVEVATGGVGLTDTELRATAVPVSQVSGANWSVNSVNESTIDVRQVSGSIDSVSVIGFTASVAASLIDSSGVQYSGSNPVPVTISSESIILDQTTDSIAVRQVSGFVDSVNVVNNNSLDVQQVSGATWSVSVNDAFRTTVASNLINSDDRLRVSVETGSIGLTNTELRASSVLVEQVSGSNWSVFATNPVNQGDADTAIRVVIAGNSDASVAATQTGTWTVFANLNAGTNNIGDVDVLTLPSIPAGTNNIGDVDILTVNGQAPQFGSGVRTASTQRVTVATDDVVPVTDNGGSLTVDNAGTFAVQATVAAAATNIAKAEDVASVDADVGVPAMAVRKATPANTSGTDGDYEMLQMSVGRLWTSATIDAALPSGTNAIGKLAANSGVDIGDVDVTSVSGNVTVVQSTATSLKVDASGVAVPVTDNAGSLTVDGTVTANAGSGTFAVSVASGAATIAKAEDVASADGDVGVPSMAVRKATPANTSGADGDYEMLQISAGRLWTSATIDTALPSGTNAIGKLAANSGVDIGDVDITSIAAGDNNIGNVDIVTMPNVTLAAGTNTNEVVGDVAHDAAIAGNPLIMGGVASATAPTDVSTDQDAVRAWHLRNGAQATVITAAGALIGGDATNGLDVDVTRLPALAAGTNNIGDVDVLTLPVSFDDGDADSTTLRQISAKSSSATTAAVSVGADASTNIVLTNAIRKSVSITHASTSNLYVATGTAVSTSSFPIVAGQVIVIDDYTGPVNAIAEEQAGTISVRYIEIF